MIDQNSQFMALLTAVGEAKQANANALGTPWIISQMGVGDANGTDPVPSRTQTALINERRRAPLNQLKIDPDNDALLIAEQVIPENVGGFWIRELGLYDTDGDLIAVANCPPTFKPELSQGSGRTQVVRLNILVSSTQNIQLKIDPSVVLATRDYVDKQTVRASQTEAEEGQDTSKLMTPKRTAEAIAKLGLKVGTEAGTAAEGNDERLSDARDWDAAVITQAEVEAGISSIPRKTTAQRLWQGFNAWFQLVTSGFGRNLMQTNNAAAARNSLELGTAATLTATTGYQDMVMGRVLQVGDYGIGHEKLRYQTADTYAQGWSIGIGDSPGLPADWSRSVTWVNNQSGKGYTENRLSLAIQSGRMAFRVGIPGGGVWEEVLHSGNLASEPGQSDKVAMSQKAVTDAIGSNSALGNEQTWQNVKENRSNGIVYTNTTGKPIQVAVTVSGASSTASGNASFYVNNEIVTSSSSSSHAWDMNVFAVVPNGATYKAQWAGGSVILRDWVELR